MIHMTNILAFEPQLVNAGIDFVAVAGILGTLLGTAIGALVTWKIQERQLLHEDKTRFHDRRLTVYAAFNTACNNIIASFAVDQSFSEIHLPAMFQNFEILRLIASEPVCDVANRVHALVGQAMRSNISQSSDLVSSFNKEMSNLCLAIRKEVGVKHF